LGRSAPRARGARPRVAQSQQCSLARCPGPTCGPVSPRSLRRGMRRVGLRERRHVRQVRGCGSSADTAYVSAHQHSCTLPIPHRQMHKECDLPYRSLESDGVSPGACSPATVSPSPHMQRKKARTWPSGERNETNAISGYDTTRASLKGRMSPQSTRSSAESSTANLQVLCTRNSAESSTAILQVL
jgi:hypothetical protein